MSHQPVNKKSSIATTLARAREMDLKHNGTRSPSPKPSVPSAPFNPGGIANLLRDARQQAHEPKSGYVPPPKSYPGYLLGLPPPSLPPLNDRKRAVAPNPQAAPAPQPAPASQPAPNPQAAPNPQPAASIPGPSSAAPTAPVRVDRSVLSGHNGVLAGPVPADREATRRAMSRVARREEAPAGSALAVPNADEKKQKPGDTRDDRPTKRTATMIGPAYARLQNEGKSWHGQKKIIHRAEEQELSKEDVDDIKTVEAARRDMIPRAHQAGVGEALRTLTTKEDAFGLDGAQRRTLMARTYGKVFMPLLDKVRSRPAREANGAQAQEPERKQTTREERDRSYRLYAEQERRGATEKNAAAKPKGGTLNAARSATNKDRLNALVPYVGTGSSNLTSDIDLNTRGPLSSFALRSINTAASKTLKGIDQKQTAGTTVDVNFYAQDYITGVAPELAGRPTRDSGQEFDVNQEVALSGPRYRDYERDQRKAALVHLVRHMDPHADGKRPSKEMPEMVGLLRSELGAASPDQRLLTDAWEEHLANQDRVIARKEELRKSAPQLGEDALISAAHQSLYEDEHQQIGKNRLDLYQSQASLYELEAKRQRDPGDESKQQDALQAQGVKLKKSLASGLYFANEAYATQGAVHHGVGVMGLRKEQRQHRARENKEIERKINLPRSGMLHSVIENAGDAFRVMKEKKAEADAKSYDGKRALGDAHKYLDRMFDATREAALPVAPELAEVKQAASAHAQVKAADSDRAEIAAKKDGASSDEKLYLDILNNGEAAAGDKKVDDALRKHWGQSSLASLKARQRQAQDLKTPDDMEGLQRLLIKHVASSMKGVASVDGEELRLAPNQSEDASAARVKAGRLEADRLLQMAGLRPFKPPTK